MQDIIDNLKSIKTRIEKAEREVAQSEGRLESATQRLKEMGIDSVEEIETERTRLQEEIQETEEIIKEKHNELKTYVESLEE